ncbi:alpha/beta hydrolase [Schaalia sp. lx-100]|uniref:alpha/beta hydrolase n=1 Tax=Schaalia sp. lx-100 TaxID=2899081 RepID=UPI001E59E53A|nr:alpha/beta hydrolase [Schaalia sp. lx-100]MCD4557797.1 alpha/beta hydrolase [Schaalia sp. lx-100]
MATRRRRSPFYTPRRIPHAVAARTAGLKLAPLVPQLALAGATTLIADYAIVPENLRATLRTWASQLGDDISEHSQRIFFDDPGLDTLLIRGISRTSAIVTTLIRTWLMTTKTLGTDRDGRAARTLPLLPRRGYDSFMTFMLTTGTAVGLLRGGHVHTATTYDSTQPDNDDPSAEHVRSDVGRYLTPHTLTDLAHDISDLYWSDTQGTTIKITQVGDEMSRRWIMSLPGTDHVDWESTPNPADTESNIREILGLPSAMRTGVLRALHEAMKKAGIPEHEYHKEKVLICGHSQGGMVAVALASREPVEMGVNVTGILSLGTPGRRFRIRPDVVMVAVEHDQDVVPSMDGTPARAPDHRVVVGRKLVRPRHNPLYYAHSSTTYAQTVRLLERKVDIAPWGKVARTVEKLRQFLPQPGEYTRVTIHEIWQEVREPAHNSRWDTFLRLERSTLTPVDYEETLVPQRQGGRHDHT